MVPFDVALADDTVVQPDVLVARRSDLTEHDPPTAPVPVVEVLSPRTRHIDLALKRARFEVAGCPAYWIVDPTARTGRSRSHGSCETVRTSRSRA